MDETGSGGLGGITDLRNLSCVRNISGRKIRKSQIIIWDYIAGTRKKQGIGDVSEIFMKPYYPFMKSEIMKRDFTLLSAEFDWKGIDISYQIRYYGL